MTRGTILTLSLLALALTALASAVMLPIDWNGEAASEEAAPIDTLLDVTIVISSAVFSIVVVAFAYALWRYRAKPGDESDGEPIHGNTRLEIVWTLIPTLIVLFAAGYSWVVLDDIEAEAGDRMPVNVTAQQFAWTFEYPEANVTSKEMHVPVGRQLELTLEALDVVHSFWVPEWRIKRDLVPSGPGGDEIDDTVLVTPDKEGTYSLVCTELCGLGHATMRAPVVVESQEEFDAWLAAQGEAQPTGSGETAPADSEATAQG